MKAPYIFSLLSPIVFKTAISFAFMTAAKSEERRGTREEATDIFCHPTVSSFLLNRTLKDHCITYSKITKSSRFMLTLRPEMYAKLLMVYYEGSDGWYHQRKTEAEAAVQRSKMCIHILLHYTHKVP